MFVTSLFIADGRIYGRAGCADKCGHHSRGYRGHEGERKARLAIYDVLAPRGASSAAITADVRGAMERAREGVSAISDRLRTTQVICSNDVIEQSCGTPISTLFCRFGIASFCPLLSFLPPCPTKSPSYVEPSSPIVMEAKC